MNASYTFTAPTGGAAYTAQIQGAGQGTPGTAGAYPAYGSLGTYQVSLATQGPSGAQPVAVADQSFSRTVGVAGSNQVVATGGNGSYAWTRTGTLPPGLSFSASGVLSGTPTTAGTYSFTATATSGSSSDPGTITVTVAGASAPLAFVTGATLPGAKLNTAYSTAITVTGGTAPYAWARTSGPLPNGMTLTFAGSTATLSGTPKTIGKWTFTLRVTDASGAVVSRTFTLRRL